MNKIIGYPKVILLLARLLKLLLGVAAGTDIINLAQPGSPGWRLKQKFETKAREW